MVYTFHVELEKDEEGCIGLALTGGKDDGDGKFVVLQLVAGKPASVQGTLQTGDVIVSINGALLQGLTLEEGCALIAASPAIVRLQIQRPGDPPSFELITIRTNSGT